MSEDAWIRSIRTSFRAKRLSSGYSLRKLSKLIGVSFATLSRFERGGTPEVLTLSFIQNWLNEDDNIPKQKPQKFSIEKQISALNERIKKLENHIWKLK